MRLASLSMFAFLVTTSPLQAQHKTDTLLRNILLSSHSEVLNTILTHPDSFRLQIIYTQINRDAH
ncbi:MAG TPA: hypothetical protein VF490_06755, partial [Chryseosolibacter sp.]